LVISKFFLKKIYFNKLNLTYLNFTKAYKHNSNRDVFKDRINFYIPLKKKTYQDKVFYQIYKIVPDINLENYYIKKIEQGHFEIINKRKNIHVTDEGKQIKSNKNNQNLVENVKLMLEVVKAKGWDLNNLHIRATEQFINEVKRQVAKENKKQSLNIDDKDAAKNLRELVKSESKKQNKDYDL
jgi:hypothetical protein